MTDRGDMASLARLLRPLRKNLRVELADALMRLKADKRVQSRYETLAMKNTEGLLTARERSELESLVRANSLLAALKAEARALLDQAKAA